MHYIEPNRKYNFLNGLSQNNMHPGNEVFTWPGISFLCTNVLVGIPNWNTKYSTGMEPGYINTPRLVNGRMNKDCTKSTNHKNETFEILLTIDIPRLCTEFPIFDYSKVNNNSIQTFLHTYFDNSMTFSQLPVPHLRISSPVPHHHIFSI